MAIQPVSLPSAAGIDYGKGDVRHFSPGDAVDVPGLQNPTRHLAERDNQLAEKVNEVIGIVNNQEQFVPMPVVRTLLAPSEEMTVYNYRIPAGFESRVLNAAISATPASSDIELKVYYNAGFGGVTGSEIVSTATEFTGGVTFYNNGEFIIALKNKSASSLELAASLLLTLRPLGAEGSLLVASVVQGKSGDPGPPGPPGKQGLPGTGGAGSPGMVWTGTYDAGHTYVPKEVASYELYGSMTSSFIATQTIPAGSLDPETAYLSGNSAWQVVALGSAGPRGIPGTVGSSGSSVSFFNTTASGSFVTGSDWIAGTSTYASFYTTSMLQASRKYSLPFQESAVLSAVNNGLATLMTSVQICFAGHGTVYLPQKADGALCDYVSANMNPIIAANGTAHVYTGTTPSATVYATADGTGFVIQAMDPVPANIGFALFGAQQVT